MKMTPLKAGSFACVTPYDKKSSDVKQRARSCANDANGKYPNRQKCVEDCWIDPPKAPKNPKAPKKAPKKSPPKASPPKAPKKSSPKAPKKAPAPKKSPKCKDGKTKRSVTRKGKVFQACLPHKKPPKKCKDGKTKRSVHRKGKVVKVCLPAKKS